MTSRAGGAAEDTAAVMHLLTPALRPDSRSSDVRLYIASEPNRNIASEANQNSKIVLVKKTTRVRESRDGVMCQPNEMNN